MADTLLIVRRGNEEHSCANCGLVFEDTDKPVKSLRAIMVAEDSPTLLRKVGEMIEAKELARTVITCKNGEELLEKAVSRMQADLPVSLVILDVNMPILNGVNAAIALRSVERAMEGRHKAPILFFTSNRCDDTFKKVLNYCAPAHYINKGTGSSPEEFAKRLQGVICVLLQKG